jgi:hypothetical protein
MNTTSPKKRTISAYETERRKQKTALVKAEIRREWKALDHYFGNKQQGNRPSTPTLARLTAAAGRDYRKRGRMDRHSLRVYWRIKGGLVITSRYGVSNLGGIRLVPPKQYERVRQAFGY